MTRKDFYKEFKTASPERRAQMIAEVNAMHKKADNAYVKRHNQEIAKTRKEDEALREQGPTPGPWICGSMTGNGGWEDATEAIAVLIVGEDGSTEVAMVHGFTPKERMKNARLIAAAPELLESLKQFARAYVKSPIGRYSRSMENLDPNNDHTFLDNVNKLIVKAQEGK